MKKILNSVLIAVLLAFPIAVNAQKKKIDKIDKEGSVAPTKVKKVPEGSIVQGNKVSLKPGYLFEKQSNNAVAVRRAGNGVITGNFSCSCQGQTGGTCSLSISKDFAACIGGCNDCRLDIVINPVASMAKNAQSKKSQ